MTDAPTRRTFLLGAGALAVGAAAPGAAAMPRRRQETPAAAPPAAAPAAPEAVTEETIAAAERLAGVAYAPGERAQMLGTIEEHLRRLALRRSHGAPGFDEAPALVFDPRLPGMTFDRLRDAPFAAPEADAGPLPDDEVDIAFAPVTALARWIRDRRITSQRLTRIYLDRLREHGPTLECVVTLTADRALAQAREADVEIARGRWRGPLHGIPWGAKDLLDTAGIPTTWGAAPYRDRVPGTSAEVVHRLDRAGAVLVAKLTLGALAYGDIWFDGRTNNPWNLEEGSSGSSAGSAAATAAGLVGFAIGTETYGSIVSPCNRCAATGLRPTFGRVPRTGAMPLCWSLDKIGPITRTVADAMLVLHAINGAHEGDPASIDMPLAWRGDAGAKGVRVGWNPAWFEGPRAALDRQVLDAVEAAGGLLVEVDRPERPDEVLLNILLAEAAAAFESLTRSGRDDELVWQDADAWPNTFRQAWFIPAIEYVQADRLRRRAMRDMHDVFERADVLISPPYAANLLLVTNHTGHPCLTLRSGMRDDGRPNSCVLWGRLFDEGTLARVGTALERQIGLWDRRPPAFGA